MRRVRMSSELCLERLFVQRIELFDPDESGVSNLLFRTEVEQVVVDFAGADDDALYRIRVG